jgi:hypothetical protein
MRTRKLRMLLMSLMLLTSIVFIPAGTVGGQAIERPAPAAPALEASDDMLASSSAEPGDTGLGRVISLSVPGSVYQAGGDRLAALQNDDGGWDWPLDDGDPTNSSPTNTVGPIAMGLAQAYGHTNDPSHLAALQKAGTFLLAKTNNFSPSDGYLAAKLDQVFGSTTYVDHVKANFYDPLAAGTYDRNGAGTLYDTAGYVNLIRTSRAGDIANLAAWDIGMGLVGAASAGASTTEWVAGLKAEIDELDGDLYYDVIGLAGAVYGLAFVGEDYDPTAGEHAAASSLSDLAAILASYQIDGGGFTWNSNYMNPGEDNETIQETSYAILALNEFDCAAYQSEIGGAADYVVSVQLATGGWKNWAGGGENNEVTGEALWGLSMADECEATAICLVSFTAQAGADGVALAWETGTEVDNAGFNLYRALTQDGPWTQINGALIPAQGDPVSGASYSFTDVPDYGTFYYQLEDVDLYGVSTMHGPVRVTVARPLRRPLYRPAMPQF